MIWRRESLKAKEERLDKWHRHFAWFPVTIWNLDGQNVRVWLDYVERRCWLARGVIAGDHDMDIWYAEYRLPVQDGDSHA